ncbi:MAG: hypothetical protein OIF54_11105 [Cohaesibacter sp.]|nr:hypothetical protein [Cohaesibacter sp.]
MKNARFNASLVTLLSGFWISPLYAGGAMTVDISNIKSDKRTIFLMAFAAEKAFNAKGSHQKRKHSGIIRRKMPSQ